MSPPNTDLADPLDLPSPLPCRRSSDLTTTSAATTALQQTPAVPVAPRRSAWRQRLACTPRPVLLAAAALALALIGLAAWRTFDVQVGDNFAEVSPGHLYRSAQLGPDALGSRIDQYRIASVINLRGAQADHAWYRDEIAVCRDRDVAHYDLHMSATQYPDPATLAQLMELLRTAPRPILVHCRSGADRTGLACALDTLLDSTDEVAAATRQLTLWHGHVAIGPNSAMDRFLSLYLGTAADLPPDQWSRWCYPTLYHVMKKHQWNALHAG